MADPVIIGTFAKNNRETVRVALDEYQGHKLIDLRVCTELSATSKTLTPTKKGLSIKVDRLPELRRLVVEAEARAIELGLLEPSR